MTASLICQICKNANFKYICPKCNIPYCSVACYKHPIHLKCSEEFYKKCIEEEILSGAADFSNKSNLSDEANKMCDILRRFEYEDQEISPIDNSVDDWRSDSEGSEKLDSDDEDIDEDLASRLDGVNLDNADELWNRLNSEEKYEFESFIRKQQVDEILPPFQPWWTVQYENKLIEDISEPSTSRKDHQTQLHYPSIQETIKPFEVLTKVEPSPCVYYNFINILASYTYVVRFFNGEYRTVPQEAASYILLLSATLRKNANFDSEEQAVKSVIYEGQTTGMEISCGVYENIRADVNLLCEGRYKGRIESVYKLAALSDIYNLFILAKNFKKKKVVRKGEFSRKFIECKLESCKELNRTKLKQVIKKIEFYLSYVHSRL